MKEPMHRRIETYLRELIESNSIKSGELLPSENQLCEQFGVSRMTVRVALNKLTAYGYITKRKGLGSIVIVNQLPDKDKASSKYLACDLEVVQAEWELANILDLEIGSNLWKVSLLAEMKGEEQMETIIYLPLAKFPTLTKQACLDIKEFFKQFNYRIALTETSYEAISNHSSLKLMMKIKNHEALLLVKHLSILESGEKIAFTNQYFYKTKVTNKSVASNDLI